MITFGVGVPQHPTHLERNVVPSGKLVPELYWEHASTCMSKAFLSARCLTCGLLYSLLTRGKPFEAPKMHDVAILQQWAINPSHLLAQFPKRLPPGIRR